MASRRAEAAGVGLAVVLLAAERVAAQCALCGSATPYASDDPSRAFRTFLAAALVLLVPVGGICAALGVYMRRHRH